MPPSSAAVAIHLGEIRPRQSRREYALPKTSAFDRGVLREFSLRSSFQEILREVVAARFCVAKQGHRSGRGPLPGNECRGIRHACK